MRCPWCGSGPVTIRGDRWECGWCGDFGTLRHIPEPPPEPQPVKMTLSFSIVYHVDLPETWKNMKTAVRMLAPRGDTALFPLLGKVLLYEISDGIRHRNSPPEPEKLQELEQFLKETPDLELDAPANSVVRTVQTDILYPQEAELSERSCGEFWRELISHLTSEQYYSREPDGLWDLLHELSSAYSYFGDTSGEEFATAQEHRSELNDAFYLHWQENVLLHPDVARARQLLAQGEFPDNEDICREILVTEFPEEAAGYTLEELDVHYWDDIVEEVLERDASKGLRMWRTLLDIASPCLSSNSETAQQLLQDWSVLDPPTLSTAEAFLTALEDERFAGQVFQSADVGNLQRNLLTVCRNFNRIELGQHCLELVLKNSYLNGAWEQRLRKALTPDVRSPKPQGPSRSMRIPSAGNIPDNGTVFHYCTVRLQGVQRSYSYLTGDLPLKVGDWVEVPFGKEDQPRCGQIGSITDCTRLAAPWPPEQTKTVLRVVEAPIEPEKTLMFSMSAPMPSPEPEPTHQQEFRHGGVSKPVVADTSPRIQESASSAENPEAERFAENSITENKQKNAPSKKSKFLPDFASSNLSKRPFSWKCVCAILAALVCIVGIGMFGYSLWSQLDQEYEYAVRLTKNGSFSEAKSHFDALDAYRDAESLSIYCLYAEKYATCTTYDGGKYELSQLTLKYTSELQSDLNNLLEHITALENQKRLEEDRAAAAKKRAEEVEAYSGTLPVDDMPYRCLSLTSLGLPDETEKCQFYDDMDVHRRFKIHKWYNSEGQIIAYCHSHWPEGEEEEVIYAFDYHDLPIGRPNSSPPLVPPFGTPDGSDPYDIEDYNNAEDFYWGNRIYFDSLDDAEIYFDNHKN